MDENLGRVLRRVVRDLFALAEPPAPSPPVPAVLTLVVGPPRPKPRS